MSRGGWGMGVVFVQPVEMPSAVFYVVCSFLMYVSAISGGQAVRAYDRIGLKYFLYICEMSSLE